MDGVGAGAVSRRQLMQGAGAVGLGLLAGCGRWPGQAAPPKVPQVGYLDRPAGPLAQAFEAGLREYGYVPAQNVAIQYALANRPLPESQDQWLEAASELVQSGVDVILAFGTPGAVAAKQATRTIPIVFAQAGNPVADGLVTSLARPGGNVTGVTNIGDELTAKHVELLKETIPHLSSLAVLSDPANRLVAQRLTEAERAVQVLGLRLLILEARGPEEFASAYAAAAQERAEAMVILGSHPRTHNVTRLAQLAKDTRLPAIYVDRLFPEAGGLMAYGSDLQAQMRRAAYYVDRILKGANPADLPVEQPMIFDLVINLRT